MKLLFLAALLFSQTVEKIEEKVKEDVATLYGDKTRQPGAVAAGSRKKAKKPAKRDVSPGSAWEVYKGDTLVLRVMNTPGLIIGTALMDKETYAKQKPTFLTGSAFEPLEEHALRGHLEKSKSTSQFLDRLDKAGYDVRPAR